MSQTTHPPQISSYTFPAKRRRILAWTLQILLGLPIAGGGAAKLFADPAMVDMFDDIGAGQWLRLFVGACEVAGGIGLLVPRVRALAALGLTTLLVGATLTNVFVLGISPLGSLAFAVLAALVLWMRRGELPSTSTR